MEYQLKDSAYTLSKDQINRLIDCTPRFRDRLILKILAGCGLRREELCNLRVADLDRRERTMRIEGKGEKVRIVPYSPALGNDLAHWLKGRRTGFVFPGKLKARSGLILRRVNDICQAAGERAGITNPNPKRRNINPHIFRHSFARAMKDRGMPFETLQNILGHSTLVFTVENYGTKSLADIRKDFDQVSFI